MIDKINASGIYFAPFAINFLLSIPVFFLCRYVLERAGVLERVWYQALFEIALFVVAFTLVLPFS
ncbi:MAG: DUF1656 domain-containing protein [Azospirillaceae bacterium]|nr:DUF1656 domain-containing protein [Azospirillaceae bacterium]